MVAYAHNEGKDAAALKAAAAKVDTSKEGIKDLEAGVAPSK